MARFRLPTTEESVRLREMSEQLRKLEPQGPKPGPPVPNERSPDTYVAKLPIDGLPARISDEPGCAECDIYRIDTVGTASGDCEEMMVLTQVILGSGEPYRLPILNISDQIITAEYVLITLEKYGRWIAQSSGAGSGMAIVGILAQNACELGECVSIQPVDACGEIVTTVCNALGIPGREGDRIVAVKQAICGGTGTGTDQLICEDTGTSTSTAEPPCPWIIMNVQPRPLCPLSDVIDRGDCLVQTRSKMYGYVNPCEMDATTEIITPIGGECEEGTASASGTEEECDLSAEWNLECDELDTGTGSAS